MAAVLKVFVVIAQSYNGDYIADIYAQHSEAERRAEEENERQGIYPDYEFMVEEHEVITVV